LEGGRPRPPAAENARYPLSRSAFSRA